MIRVAFPYQQSSSSLATSSELYPASFAFCCSRNKQRVLLCTIVCAIPARDVVIDFGKFKGSRMGTLPAGYLRWLTREAYQKGLAAWGEYAQQVLQDPYYKDRLEWQSIEKLTVRGDMRKGGPPLSSAGVKGSMQALGWDLSDHQGWSKVNFSLLGTSLGGRIPRKELDPSASNPKPTIISRLASEKPTMKASLSSSSSKLSPRLRPASASKKSSLPSPTPHKQASGVEPQPSLSLKEELLRRRRLRKERAALKSSMTQSPTSTDDVKTLFAGRDSFLLRMKNRADR